MGLIRNLYYGNRLVEVEQGKKGQWRWYAREGRRIVAMSNVSGFTTPGTAHRAFKRLIRGRWSLVVRPYKQHEVK